MTQHDVVQGRDCSGCTLCCKLLTVEELNTPPLSWSGYHPDQRCSHTTRHAWHTKENRDELRRGPDSGRPR